MDVFHGDEDKTTLGSSYCDTAAEEKPESLPCQTSVHSLEPLAVLEHLLERDLQPHQADTAEPHHIPQPGVSGRAPAAVKASHVEAD